MSDQAKQNRERVNRFRDRQREAGLVQRTKWAHPDDWPKIDTLIEKLNKARE